MDKIRAPIIVNMKKHTFILGPMNSGFLSIVMEFGSLLTALVRVLVCLTWKNIFIPMFWTSTFKDVLLYLEIKHHLFLMIVSVSW